MNQGQTNEKAGFTFARGLRAILRQDPDVIMVGEIRDARDAADGGRGLAHRSPRVLDAAHQQRRRHGRAPVDMGLEPYLLASSLLGIVAQRLVRTHLQDLSNAKCRRRRAWRISSARTRRKALSRPGLPRLPRHRVSRPRRDSRARDAQRGAAHLIMDRAPESKLHDAAVRNGTVRCATSVWRGSSKEKRPWKKSCD